MLDALVVILSFVWIPTVVGLYRIWKRYFRMRKITDPWLFLVFGLIAVLVTPVVLFISYSSAIRLLGAPPLAQGPVIGAFAAIDIALVVPLIEIAIWLWSRGSVADPTLPEILK